MKLCIGTMAALCALALGAGAGLSRAASAQGIGDTATQIGSQVGGAIIDSAPSVNIPGVGNVPVGAPQIPAIPSGQEVAGAAADYAQQRAERYANASLDKLRGEAVKRVQRTNQLISSIPSYSTVRSAALGLSFGQLLSLSNIVGSFSNLGGIDIGGLGGLTGGISGFSGSQLGEALSLTGLGGGGGGSFDMVRSFLPGGSYFDGYAGISSIAGGAVGGAIGGFTGGGIGGGVFSAAPSGGGSGSGGSRGGATGTGGAGGLGGGQGSGGGGIFGPGGGSGGSGGGSGGSGGGGTNIFR